MVALSFSVFKEKVKRGEKCQTIRPYTFKRFEMIMRLRVLQLYWKQRTKKRERLGTGHVTKIFRIYFNTFFKEVWVEDYFGCGFCSMSETESRDLALRDGFDSFEQMFDYFKNVHGDLDNKVFMVIRWRLV